MFKTRIIFGFEILKPKNYVKQLTLHLHFFEHFRILRLLYIHFALFRKKGGSAALRIINYTITDEYTGRPLLHFLKGYVKLSTHIVQTLRHTPGAVTVNGTPFRLTDKVTAGDFLEIHLPEKSTPPLLWQMPLSVIFEDDDILIVNKPSGIAVHPTHNHPNGTLCNIVANHLAKNENPLAVARAVGRLDKVTSGVMIFAKSAFCASRLNGNIEKVYYAIVTGNPCESGTIDAPIYRPDSGKTCRTVDERGDRAVTHWQIAAHLKDSSLLKIRTETGRTHQIRVHCAYIGHPLVGDEMYGGTATESIKRAALHCAEVSFTHPVNGAKLTFTAPLPKDMRAELEKNGIFVDKSNIIC